MNRIIFKITAVFLVGMMFCSCGKDEELQGNWLVGTAASFSVGSEGVNLKFPIAVAKDFWHSRITYENPEQAGWLNLNEEDGLPGVVSLSVEIAPNASEESRSASVALECHGEIIRFDVKQRGKEAGSAGGEEVKKDIVRGIAIVYYDKDMARIYTETLSVDYDGEKLVGVSSVSEDAATSQKKATTVKVDDSGKMKSYVLNQNGSSDKTYIATIGGDGAFETFSGVKFIYQEGYLQSVEGNESVWNFAWHDGNLQSASSVGQNVSDLKIWVSDLALTANLNLDAVFLFTLFEKDKLWTAVFAEQGNWGRASSKLLWKVSENGGSYVFNALKDEKGRIVKAMQYFSDGGDYTHQKTYEITYAD